MLGLGASGLALISAAHGYRKPNERSGMKDILDEVTSWRNAGKQIAIARVVDIEGSGPRDPGAAMAVNQDGEVIGSVSGGCVEGAVVTEALDIIESGERRMVTFGFSDDEAFAVGLTCGGTIHLYIEPLDW
jgi:xanthine dehydrogenase accessory factor